MTFLELTDETGGSVFIRTDQIVSFCHSWGGTSCIVLGNKTCEIKETVEDVITLLLGLPADKTTIAVVRKVAVKTK